MAKVKTYTKEFKFKVAIEMLRGELTTAQLSAKFQVPSSVATRWKNELLERGAAVFSHKMQDRNLVQASEIEHLHATIGKLKVENDFLSKASAKLRL